MTNCTLHLFYSIKSRLYLGDFSRFYRTDTFTVIIPAASSDPVWNAHFLEFGAIEKEILNFSLSVVMNLLTEWTIISCTVWSGCVGMRFVERSSTCSLLVFR